MYVGYVEVAGAERAVGCGDDSWAAGEFEAAAGVETEYCVVTG